MPILLPPQVLYTLLFSATAVISSFAEGEKGIYIGFKRSGMVMDLQCTMTADRLGFLGDIIDGCVQDIVLFLLYVRTLASPWIVR
jgi:hypothetical protein